MKNVKAQENYENRVLGKNCSLYSDTDIYLEISIRCCTTKLL